LKNGKKKEIGGRVRLWEEGVVRESGLSRISPLEKGVYSRYAGLGDQEKGGRTSLAKKKELGNKRVNLF